MNLFRSITKEKILLGIFFVTIAIIINTFINENLVPTVQVEIKNTKPVGPIIKGTVFVQEIQVKKKYLSGIDLFLATWARANNNTNCIFIFDDSQELIFSRTFSSQEVRDNSYFRLDFSEKKKIGKGNTVSLYIYSSDGNNENNITVWTDTTSSFGRLHVTELAGWSTEKKLKNSSRLLPGSMILKTFESDYKFNLLRTINYIIIIFVTALIVFSNSLKSRIRIQRIQPHRLYFITSTSFGFLFVFLTPPFQVPDEQVHFFRAYQLSDNDYFQLEQTIPKSLQKLSTLSLADSMEIWHKMHYNLSDFESFMEIKLEPENTVKTWSYWYIIPYIPQGIGISVGRIFRCNPLCLMYMGRIFNLIFAIVIIGIAIKIIPIHKWSFVLLALMPMTITQMASNSYDAVTIGLSFLSVSYFLYLKFIKQGNISNRDLFIVFVINILLAFCRPVYCCIGLLFLLIPVFKLGSKTKYIFVFFSLLISMSLAPFLFSLVRFVIAESNPLIAIPWKDPHEQINFIMENFTVFIKVIIKTCLVTHRDFYISSFVGTLGWLDNPLPRYIVNSFVAVLILNTLLNRTSGIRISARDRVIWFIVATSGFLAIETAIYITWSPVGHPFIEGAQGRYFIPLVPILLLIFYTTSIYKNIFGCVYYFYKYLNKEQPNSHMIKKKAIGTLSQLTIYSHLSLVFFIYYTLIVTCFTIVNRYYLN